MEGGRSEAGRSSESKKRGAAVNRSHRRLCALRSAASTRKHVRSRAPQPNCGTTLRMPIIESIPNVSEGRRADIVERMAEAIRQVPGVRLLDHSSDPSHNRSVFTLVGEAQPLRIATLALFEQALASIDLRQHQGEHPRLGAVDVVPFV